MADKKRLAYVQQGLIALDEEQALVKSGIEDLLEEYQKTEHTTSPGRAISARGNAVSNLILGLQKLVKEELPRVSYPDRKLLEPSEGPDGQVRPQTAHAPCGDRSR